MIDLSNTAAIYARAREAYANGELQAQTLAGPNYCSYKAPCAIGVSMTLEQRDIVEPFDEGSGIEELLRAGIVVGNLRALSDLQVLHDEFYQERKEQAQTGNNEKYMEQAEARFLTQLEKY